MRGRRSRRCACRTMRPTWPKHCATWPVWKTCWSAASAKGRASRVTLDVNRCQRTRQAGVAGRIRGAGRRAGAGVGGGPARMRIGHAKRPWLLGNRLADTRPASPFAAARRQSGMDRCRAPGTCMDRHASVAVSADRAPASVPHRTRQRCVLSRPCRRARQARAGLQRRARRRPAGRAAYPRKVRNANAGRSHPRAPRDPARARQWHRHRGVAVGGLVMLPAGGETARIEPMKLPDGLRWCCVYSGRPASTGAMLETIAAWREREPTAFTHRNHELATISSRGIDAMAANDAAAFLSSLHDYADALASFGEAAGADIASREHRAIAAIAADCGCVYKSCGAGGGDVGVTFAVEDTRLRAFAGRAAQAGYPVIGLAEDPKGLAVASND